MTFDLVDYLIAAKRRVQRIKRCALLAAGTVTHADKIAVYPRAFSVLGVAGGAPVGVSWAFSKSNEGSVDAAE